MANRFLVVKLLEAQLDAHGAFVGLDVETGVGTPVAIALIPEIASDLARVLLSLLSDGTKRGILPPQLHPTMTPLTALEASASGVHVTYQLSDGLRIQSEMPWTTARDLGEKLVALCDDYERGSPSPN